MDAPHFALEGVLVTRRFLCAQLDADAQDTAMALQSSSYDAFKRTPLLTCSKYNTVSTEHRIIIYCVIHAGTCSSCNDPVAFKLTMVSPDTVGIISDVTFNKVVGYNMYDDVDGHRRTGQHPLGGGVKPSFARIANANCLQPTRFGGGGGNCNCLPDLPSCTPMLMTLITYDIIKCL